MELYKQKCHQQREERSEHMGDDVCSKNHNQTQPTHILCRTYFISLPLCHNTLIYSARQLTRSVSQFSLCLYFSTIITQECSRTTTNNSSDCEGNVACSFPFCKTFRNTWGSSLQGILCCLYICYIHTINSRIADIPHEKSKNLNKIIHTRWRWIISSKI